MPGIPATSPRFAAPRYANTDTSDFAGQVNAVTDALDLAARIDSGTAAGRPATSVANGFYYATDTRQLSRWTGTAWENVAPGAHAATHQNGGTDPLTVNEAMMATGAAGLGAGSFRAWRSAALGAVTGAGVVFDTDSGANGWDVSGWYDVALGRYTPQIPGRYRLSWAVRCGETLAADVYWFATLRKNGGDIAIGSTGFQRGTATFPNSVGTDVVVANGTTDFFDVSINHNKGAGLSTAIQNVAQSTYFAGELIGRT